MSEEKIPIDATDGDVDLPSSAYASSHTTVDPVAEAKLLRKLDRWLAPMMVVAFLVAYLDRSNIAIAGMNEDLHLTGNRLNVAVTVFYVTYIIFEIPASLILKRARPSRLIPFFILAWSATVIGSAFVKNYAGLLATRLLIGMFESGLFPCLTLYLSTYYKREEQARRVSYLFVAAALSGAFGGLLAYGLTGLHGAGGLAGWRWLFLIEGVISLAVGLAFIFLLPDSFESAKWLTEHDKALMRIRADQSRVYQGDSEGFDKTEVMLAFRDPKVWLSAACQFCANTCSFGFGTFLPVIIRGFGYSSIKTQLLTVPVYI
ncbi:major facilitator superfamily transporter [Diaporthe helianthi]|uniref:Major facilitator superfamily transporter n=1 Tax=Diaporthe helianthi TaxID=158607 RepID=A0A2P5I9N0_DIAHE|nr:major facilitator superfamily transporter [Diaporthe helianthi]